jgi:histidyl-tRNA synthetase
MQCDFDTIGTKSLTADVETALVINDLMERIDLKTKTTFEKFKIRINNRMVLNGLLEKLGLVDHSTAILRAIDKFSKIGRENVVAEIVQTTGAGTEQAESVLRFATLKGSNEEILRELGALLSGSSLGGEGVLRLRGLLETVRAAGVPENRMVIDVSIARGLDYYTGTIYETFLDELPGIGSVCSGGRYDNLAGLYTKQELPGVGASLGLDRLLTAMEELGMIEKMSTPVEYFMPYFVEERLADYVRIAGNLRRSGVGVELYPEAKKLGAQLKYADRKGFRYAIIIGEDEFAKGVCQVKDLKTGESTEREIFPAGSQDKGTIIETGDAGSTR